MVFIIFTMNLILRKKIEVKSTYCIMLADGTIFMRSLSRDAYWRSLVTNIVNSVGSNVIESLSYSYDALNRPISRNADTFGYNDRSEVTSANISGIPTAYDYDEIGNLLLSAQNIVTNLYTANNLNQYTSMFCSSRISTMRSRAVSAR